MSEHDTLASEFLSTMPGRPSAALALYQSRGIWFRMKISELGIMPWLSIVQASILA